MDAFKVKKTKLDIAMEILSYVAVAALIEFMLVMLVALS